MCACFQTTRAGRMMLKRPGSLWRLRELWTWLNINLRRVQVTFLRACLKITVSRSCETPCCRTTRVWPRSLARQVEPRSWLQKCRAAVEQLRSASGALLSVCQAAVDCGVESRVCQAVVKRMWYAFEGLLSGCRAAVESISGSVQLWS